MRAATPDTWLLTSFGRGDGGVVENVVRQATVGTPRTDVFEYGPDGVFILKHTNPLGHVEYAGYYAWVRTFDNLGRITSLTSPNQAIETWAYPTGYRTVHSDAQQRVTEREHTAGGLLRKPTRTGVDPTL